MSHNNKPPAPDQKLIPWDLYRDLHSNGPACKAKIPFAVVKKVKKSFTLAELTQYEFTNEDDALTACLRTVALLNIPPATPSVIRSKAYLLFARSTVWLASKAHADNASKPPTSAVKEKLNNIIRNKDLSVSKKVDNCLQIASSDRDSKSLALTILARVMVGLVASDSGHHARPAMAEGWLLAAEVEVMLAELEAAIQGPSASGWKPSGRRGLFEAPPGEESPADDAYNIGWMVSVPIYTDPSDKTYLATYWNGQPASVAGPIAGQLLLGAFRFVQRYKRLADAALRDTLWSRERRVEYELFRRGAMALANLDHDTSMPNADSRERALLEDLRMVFPGSPFEPTEELVRTLKIKSPADPTPEHKFEWHLGCMLGGMGGGPNRTIISINDSYGRWEGHILASKLLEGPVPDQHYIPTPEELFKILLATMAGAGDETRCHVGPPRRPKTVTVSYRLRKPQKVLAKLLARVQVGCALDSIDNLQFACGNNLTDFETGQPIDNDDDDENTDTIPVQQTLVGQLVGLVDLLGRKDLNGRVGRVVRWHADQGRWQVKLLSFLDGEDPIVIGIKPTNLISCPQKFEDTNCYLEYRDYLRDMSPGEQSSDKHVTGPILDRLQAVGSEVDDDELCAICQQDIGSQDVRHFDLRHGARLPCGHVFHLSCIFSWIKTDDMAECPCCRSSI
jgi:hypothetical protein